MGMADKVSVLRGLNFRRPNKVVQFRCPKCLRLLIKYDIGEERTVYQADELRYWKDVEKDELHVICTKKNCNHEFIIKDGKVV